MLGGGRLYVWSGRGEFWSEASGTAGGLMGVYPLDVELRGGDGGGLVALAAAGGRQGRQRSGTVTATLGAGPAQPPGHHPGSGCRAAGVGPGDVVMLAWVLADPEAETAVTI